MDLQLLMHSVFITNNAGIYLSALDTIGWSKMNKRLPDSSTRGVAKCLYIARERKKNQMSNFKYIDLKVTLPKVCEYK
jgi:uncharacterized membrane protein